MELSQAEPAGAVLSEDQPVSTWILSDDSTAAGRLARSLHSSRSACGWSLTARELRESGISTCSCLILWYRGGEPERELLPVLENLQGVQTGHVILLSSAEIYLPGPRHPGMVSEDFAPRETVNPVARHWLALERRVREQFLSRPPTLSILRLPVVLEGRDSPWSRFLRGKWATPFPGYDPPLQFLAWDDLVAVIERVRSSRPEGLFHLAPTGVVPLRRALRIVGARALPLPFWLQKSWLRLSRGSPAAAGLAYRRYSWTISGDRIREELGFQCRNSSTRALLEFRQLPERKTAADDAAPFDDYGMDRDWIDRLGGSFFRYLERYYWRISVSGLEELPPAGKSFLLVGLHRGYIPVDAIMTLHVLASRRGIYPRFLVHPGLLKFPFVSNVISRLGGVIACRGNARRLLDRGEVLGVFPEGVRAAFSLYRDAYRLGRFLNREFIRLAIEYQIPIVPFVVLGAAESLPCIAQIHWKWWKKRMDWPCLPVAPPFPLPGKWKMQLMAPIVPPEPTSAGDTAGLEKRLEEHIRALLQDRLDDWRRS